MWKKVVIVLAAVLTILIGVVAVQPAEFAVERSTRIAAAPPTVFALVNDFHRWDAWSPWAKLDPDMTTTYEGAEAGVGAIYRWSGNDAVGEGRMTITESVPHEKVVIRLEFIKPLAATNVTRFEFSEADGATEVRWRMEGKNDFVGKAFGLFMDMDTLVGGDFEQGLATLKTRAEAG